VNFYIATDPETGRKIWGKRQDEAKKIDRDFEKRDVDTSQDGLIQVFQDYEDRIAELTRGMIETAAIGIEIASRDTGEPDGSGAAEEGSTPSLPQPDPEPEIVQDDGIMGLNASQLAPVVEQAVERLGELGETGFEAMEAYQGQHGIPGSFSRGTHILSVLCTGEHQLTRLLFRSKKQRKP